jgi:hypothetical protein
MLILSFTVLHLRHFFNLSDDLDQVVSVVGDLLNICDTAEHSREF